MSIHYVQCQLNSGKAALGMVGRRIFNSGLSYKDAAGHAEARRANYLSGNRLQERESDEVPAAGRFRDDY
ncbi:hypothetical protein ACROYT_G009459 [Oculina patagonica]